MVLEKLTLFELHFEDAQFGPRRMSAGDESDDMEAESGDEADSTDAEGSGGGRVIALVGASVLLALGATLVARRLFGGDEQTTVDDFAEEPVDAEESIAVEGEDAAA